MGCLLPPSPPTFRGDPHREAWTSPQTVWGRAEGKGEGLHGKQELINNKAATHSHSQFSVNYGPGKWLLKI